MVASLVRGESGFFPISGPMIGPPQGPRLRAGGPVLPARGPAGHHGADDRIRGGAASLGNATFPANPLENPSGSPGRPDKNPRVFFRPFARADRTYPRRAARASGRLAPEGRGDPTGGAHAPPHRPPLHPS